MLSQWITAILVLLAFGFCFWRAAVAHNRYKADPTKENDAIAGRWWFMTLVTSIPIIQFIVLLIQKIS